LAIHRSWFVILLWSTPSIHTWIVSVNYYLADDRDGSPRAAVLLTAGQVLCARAGGR